MCHVHYFLFKLTDFNFFVFIGMQFELCPVDFELVAFNDLLLFLRFIGVLFFFSGTESVCVYLCI